MLPAVRRLSCRRLRLGVAAVALALIGNAQAQTASTSPDGASAPAQTLDAVNVSDTRYKATRPAVPKFALPLFGWSFAFPAVGTLKLPEYVVTATRTPQAPKRVAASAQVFKDEQLNALPAVTLDSALRVAPSFSLFRRTDSLVAHPTAQGVSLRGVGPSGASRSLVLLDGVPLNDPFGGWINWSKVPRDVIWDVEVLPGAGAAAWGNAALSGAVQVITRPPDLQFTMIDEPPAPMRFGYRGIARASFLLGDFGLRSIGLELSRPAGPGIVQAFGESFTFDGFRVIAPEDRGPIDVPAWSRHRSLTLRYRTPLGANAEVTTAVRGFEEFRGNGTPYQRNGTREKFASVNVAAQPAERFTWALAAYAQDQSFASTFSSVNAGRTAETPASEQFAVPTTAIGASWTGTWSHANKTFLRALADTRTSGGFDARTVQGETRENYGFAAGTFTRERIAGGSQRFLGAFVIHERLLAPTLRLTAGSRLDAWTDANGHRRERERASGAVSRNDRYDDKNGDEVSPNIGIVWQPVAAWRVRANAQRSFRRPTLNELYRPFRQGPNITEPNERLRTEHSRSAEVGAEFTLSRQVTETSRDKSGRAKPTTTTAKLATAGVTVFWNQLDDAVANVTVARGPGTHPLFGTLPTGTIGRQRLNLDETRVQGAEATGSWSIRPNLTLDASYLYNDAIVRRAVVAPALVGKRLAEVPRHSASLSATWKPASRLTVTPRVRWIGRQFDDDENTLRLADAVVVDAGVAFKLTPAVELFLNAENLGNARIETARTADGVVSTGTPRFVFGGVRGRW